MISRYAILGKKEVLVMSTMSIDTLIGHVTRICQKNGVHIYF